MKRRVHAQLFAVCAGILLAYCSGTPTQPNNNNGNNGNNQTQTCSYSAQSATLPASGGSGSIQITQMGNTACAWTVAATTDPNNWLTVTGSQPGSGSGTVSYSAGINSSSTSRSATLTISWSGNSTTSTITQDAGGGCVVGLSSNAQSEPSTGKADQFLITPSAACGTWQVSADVPWITGISPSSGVGNTVVNFTVLSNSGAVRTGNISVTSGTSNATLIITQDGATALTAVLKITSTTGKGANTCDLIAVGSNAGIQCTFDGSGSFPAASINKYEFFINDTGTSLGTGSILPTSGTTVITTCSVLSKLPKTGTKPMPTIKLVVTSTDGHTAPALQLITLTSTGPC